MPVDLSLRDDIYISGVDIKDKFLMHFGVGVLDGAPGRGSGRYPLGSGENPNQRGGDILTRYDAIKAKYPTMKEADIAKELGCKSTGDLRLEMKIARNTRKMKQAYAAKQMQEEGKSNREIAEILGLPHESSVRSLVKTVFENQKLTAGQQTMGMLENVVKEKKVVDIGEGVSTTLGVSQGALDEAARRLEKDGYEVIEVKLPQPTNPHQRTTYKLLVDPSLETGVNDDGDPISIKKYIYDHPDIIGTASEYKFEGGEEGFVKRQKPASIDSSRVGVVYAEEGGVERDGTMLIRPGVADLNMGSSDYAQVRILVDGTHYLKGMAMYGDNLPPGKDILFYTNKHEGTPMCGEDSNHTVLKKVKSDPNNPFGADFTAQGQSTYMDADGNEHLSPINKLKMEGDWDKQTKTLSQQFLSKQPLPLIERQLKLTYESALEQYDTISNLSNPTLRKKMLQDFGDECDGATYHLKASSLPGQQSKVLIPMPELKDNECYCPTYETGTRVALIRFPHAGTFEIPELVVNNNNRAAKSAMGQASDAIGINAHVAERLSGADFDGDSVTVIPQTDTTRIKTSPPLEGLRDFNPKEQYAYREGMKVMTKEETQKQMGIVSNLITDMTLRGAPPEDLVKAVKHSMVVIDAEKHGLDYTRSEVENDIPALKKKYQLHVDPDTGRIVESGAATLLSMRKQDVRIPERRGSGRIDKETGEWIYNESGRKFIDPKTGKERIAEDKVARIYTVKDAFELSTGTPQENLYASYINKMKALGNKARKESANMKGLEFNKDASLKYKDEVASIQEKLDTAIKNSPLERRAVAIANSRIKMQIAAHPEQYDEKDKKAIKKLRKQEMDAARIEAGAQGKRTRIDLSDKEWEAIQAGAIHDSKASKVFRYCDQDKLKERAMPKDYVIPDAKVSRIKSMAKQGYTQAEIAKHLGVSTSSVSKYMNE